MSTQDWKYDSKLTVDSDGNALREGIAVRANECRDLAKLVRALVFLGDVVHINIDNIEVNVVGLRDREDRGGAGILLRNKRPVSLVAFR